MAGVGGCSDPPGWMDPRSNHPSLRVNRGCEYGPPLSCRRIELCTMVDLRRRCGVSGECLMRAYNPVVCKARLDGGPGGGGLPSSLE